MEAASPDDDRTALAIISLSGQALRYAEVEPGADGPRLRRLGTCDFEGEAARAVFGGGHPDTLDAVREALGEVFAGTRARALVVAAHPPDTTSFFAVLPSGMDAEAREAHLRQEAALLSDVPPTQPVRVRAVPVRTETHADGERTWVHVVHVAEPVHARLALLAQALGVTTYDLADTTRAAAATLRATDAAPTPGALSLAVGVYPAHTEVALMRDGAFVFGYHGPGATPEDTAYFALAAVERVGATLDALVRVAAYGDPACTGRTALLDEMTGQATVALDPFGPFGRRPAVSPADLAAFVPVLGATLG